MKHIYLIFFLFLFMTANAYASKSCLLYFVNPLTQLGGKGAITSSDPIAVARDYISKHTTGRFTQLHFQDDGKATGFGYENEVFGVYTSLSTRYICCPIGYVPHGSTRCNAYCPEGTNWDESLRKCQKPEKEKTCETKGNNPIDYVDGHKYRYESVATTGQQYPFRLVYYYNNQGNYATSLNGLAVSQSNPGVLAHSISPISQSDFDTLYNANKALKAMHREDQHIGAMTQYWRHNYDDVLQKVGDHFFVHQANGESIKFRQFGSHKTYKRLSLRSLRKNEMAFEGYKLNDSRGEDKYFDLTGRLRIIKKSERDFLTLVYKDASLVSITNEEGAFINIENEKRDSLSSHVTEKKRFNSYPIKTTTDRGDVARIEWNRSFIEISGEMRMITRITDATTDQPKTARDFIYSDPKWPASITEMWTVLDISKNTRKQYAEFQYDERGRAIHSSLADGVDAERVEYVNDMTRVVTNALGKKARYEFKEIDGVTRLDRVIGEPTSHCLESEVDYSYNENGNIKSKQQNGLKTAFDYDKDNRIIKRVEGVGSIDERTIKYEWHPTLDLKTKKIERKMTTEWEYDEKGQLVKTHRYPTVKGN